MFNKIVTRRLTKEDDISRFPHAEIHIKKSIDNELAYGAFKGKKCIGYIAPVDAMHLYNSGSDMNYCGFNREMYEELASHFQWAKNIICVPRVGGDRVADLLIALYSNYHSDTILYTPYFNYHEEFEKAGFSNMQLLTKNKEILIK